MKNIFFDGVNLTWLASKTGISKRTLYNYRECPERIPFAKAVLIAKAAGKIDELGAFLARVAKC